MAIPRLFIELGATDRFTPEMTKMMKSLDDLGVKATGSGKYLLGAFDAALNPTKRLAEEISLLEKAGRSQAEIMVVMGDRIRAASATAMQHGQAIDPVVKKYGEMGGMFENVGKSITDFVRNPLQTMQAGLTGLLEKAGPVAVGIGAIATAAVTAGVAIFRFMADAADSMEKLENLSAITGLATQELEALALIAKEAGLESMDLGRMIGKMNDQLGDTKPNEFTTAMKRLGISTKDTAGNAKDAITVLDEMRAALLQTAAGTDRAQLAAQLFTGRQRELIPFLVNSEKGLRELIAAKIKAGETTDDLTKNKLAALDRALDACSASWNKVKVSAVTFVADAVSAFSYLGRSDMWKALFTGNWAKNLDEDLNKVGKGITESVIKPSMDLDRLLRIMKTTWEDGAKARAKAEEEEKKGIEETRKKLEELQKYREGALKDIMALASKATAAFNAEVMAYVKTWLGYIDAIAEIGAAIQKVFSDAYAQLDKFATRDPLKGLVPDAKEAAGDIKRYQDVFEKAGKAAEDFAGKASRQISTVFTDMSKCIVDSIIKWESPGGVIMGALKEFGKGGLRILIEELLNPFEAAFTKLMKNFVDQLGGLFSGKGFDIGGLIGGTGGTTGTGGTGGKVGWGALSALGGLTSLVGGGMLALFSLTQGPVITRAIDALMAEVAKQTAVGTVPGATSPGAGASIVDAVSESLGRATSNMENFARATSLSGDYFDMWGRKIGEYIGRIEGVATAGRNAIASVGAETTRSFVEAAKEITRATTTMEGFNRVVSTGIGMIMGPSGGAASFGGDPNDRSGTGRLSVAVDPFTHEALAAVLAAAGNNRPVVNITVNGNIIGADGVDALVADSINRTLDRGGLGRINNGNTVNARP